MKVISLKSPQEITGTKHQKKSPKESKNRRKNPTLLYAAYF
jgi:hypothetical protein